MASLMNNNSLRHIRHFLECRKLKYQRITNLINYSIQWTLWRMKRSCQTSINSSAIALVSNHKLRSRSRRQSSVRRFLARFWSHSSVISMILRWNKARKVMKKREKTKRKKKMLRLALRLPTISSAVEWRRRTTRKSQKQRNQRLKRAKKRKNEELFCTSLKRNLKVYFFQYYLDAKIEFFIAPLHDLERTIGVSVYQCDK